MTVMPFGFDGFGVLAIFWVLLGLAFWVLVVVGIVLAIRWLIRADRASRLGPPPGVAPGPAAPGAVSRPEDPLEILRQRYARGEIDEEEYERRRTTLTGG